jgi:Protein of unknown function (DUF2752)
MSAASHAPVPASTENKVGPGRHREMLIVTTLILLGAFGLKVRADQRVAPRGFPGLPLPETCHTRAWFGVKCPGCGLTRSFIYLAEGDWKTSLATHRIGWLMALAVLLQFPYRLLCLRWDGPRGLTLQAARWFGCFLIVALVGNWLYDLVWSLPGSF